MRTFTLSLFTPETSELIERVESVVVPGEDGLFGVLAGHTPLVAVVGGGVLKIVCEGAEQYRVVGAGLIEVTNDRVTVMGDALITASSLADAEDRWEAYARKVREPVPLVDGHYT